MTDKEFKEMLFTKGKEHINSLSEHQVQSLLFEWAEICKNKYKGIETMYAVPNAGKRSKSAGARLKEEGLKSGVPDICLPVPKGLYAALYIELKVSKNKPTKSQLEWIEKLNKFGNMAVVCYGFDEARHTIEEYFKL